MKKTTMKNEFSPPNISKASAIKELTLALIESNNQLRESNDRLEQSEQLRKDMLSNLSHDLRSPIATLIGLVEYLKIADHNDTEDVQSTLTQMKDKLFHLNSIVEDILTLSTLDTTPESDDDDFEIENVHLAPFLSHYYETIKKSSLYNDRQLIYTVPNNLDCVVRINKKQIERVLDNLFSNALKFSCSDDIIELGAYRENKAVTFFVRDTGIGISAENKKYIFNRTYKASNARTPENLSGCGLGLSIVESIVHNHNGQVKCVSKLEQGSTFKISLALV